MCLGYFKIFMVTFEQVSVFQRGRKKGEEEGIVEERGREREEEEATEEEEGRRKRKRKRRRDSPGMWRCSARSRQEKDVCSCLHLREKHRSQLRSCGGVQCRLWQVGVMAVRNRKLAAIT
ncbi:hypothetical protein BHE74_00034248 [Ensete ventricosum]|nr:hypothetical protein BHE74_00034248 [Ensete ventricosum]